MNGSYRNEQNQKALFKYNSFLFVSYDNCRVYKKYICFAISKAVWNSKKKNKNVTVKFFFSYVQTAKYNAGLVACVMCVKRKKLCVIFNLRCNVNAQ